MSSCCAAAATPFALPHLATGATARHGLVLVTADLASHIVVVDGGDRSACGAGSRPARRRGRSSASAGPDAIVAHTTEGVVSLIDGDNRRVDKVLTRLPAPALRRRAPAPGVRVRDRLGRRRGGRRSTCAARPWCGGSTSAAPARHVSISASGTRVWTALGSTASHLAVLDTSTPDQPRAAAPGAAAVPRARRRDRVELRVGVGHVGRSRPHRHLPPQRREADRPDRRRCSRRSTSRSWPGGRSSRAATTAPCACTTRASGRLQRTTAVPAGSFNVTAGGRSHRDAVAGARHDRDPRPRRPAAARAPRRGLVARRLLDRRLASGNTAGSRAASRQ